MRYLLSPNAYLEDCVRRAQQVPSVPGIIIEQAPVRQGRACQPLQPSLPMVPRRPQHLPRGDQKRRRANLTEAELGSVDMLEMQPAHENLPPP